ncbi:MAG: HAMP domain-containing protein [Myxococcales bacterium]|nr:HAMP domain-containing protein [Myxococcales bacterium]
MSTFGSIRFRIVAAFLAAMTMMLLALVFLMVQYQGVGRSQALVTDGYLPLDIQVDQLAADHQRIETDIDRLLRSDRRPGTGAASAAAIYSERLLQTVAEMEVHRAQAVHMAADAQERAALHKVGIHLEQITTLASEWQGGARDFVGLSEAGHVDQAASLTEQLRQQGRAVAAEIALLSKQLDDRILAVTTSTDRMRRWANGVALLLTGLALVLSLALVGAVQHALRPIGRLTAQVQRLAAGDYTGSVEEVRGGGEIAVLATEFNRMILALQHRDRTLVERAEELNRLSRHLARVLDSLQDALFVVESGMVTLTNPAAETLWGVHVGAPPPADVQPWLAGGAFHEHRVGRCAYEVRANPFGEGGVVMVISDVTEQRGALEQLARSERLALVGQMLAQITHEVRNPLNALSLNAEMLNDELHQFDPSHTSEAWDLLGTITGEIDRLTQVTGHYLQLARRPPARLNPEDIGALVGDVVRLLRAELDQQGVRIEVSCAPLGAQMVDGNQLRQALLNVVRNAAEAGAHQLSIRVGSVDDEIHIALTDDGPGMDDEQVDRAFDPFFSTKASGTGLGLAITRQILEDHGGTIHVRSAPGQGTTLVLALPQV